MSADSTEQIIGQSDNFVAALEQASRVAPVAKPVLIVGERGTGKELIAARIHYLSDRWERSFVKFNCAAMHEELLESELFGHVSGAYTGATRARTGRFELADGGTLFLDELASMSLRLQEKLLRVVEYGEFERLGASETRQVDVRLIGASNVDLPALAQAGRFREDLLDRLAFEVITLPPLRERREDIVLLAGRFAEVMAGALGHELFAGFSPAAEQQLLTYHWPGNVRELRNVVERAVYRLTAPAEAVTALDIDPFASPYRPTRGKPEPGPAPIAAAAAGTRAPVALPCDFAACSAAFETELLNRALRDARHNQRRAAESLGLSYHQFRGMLRKYHLPDRKSAGA